MALKGAFLGIGNPLLDLSADVDQAFLDKYGVKMNNAILAEKQHMGIYDELVKNPETKKIAAGATLNSVRVCQWMVMEEGVTGYIGCVGKDDNGSDLEKVATADGVSMHLMKTDKAPTGCCAALIMDKERSLVTKLEAANEYKKEEHFDLEETQKVVEAAKYFYSAGFFLTVSPPTVQAVGAHAAEKNKIFAMNLSAPFICQFFKDPLMAALPFADIVFGNESEAETLGATMGYDDKSPKGVAMELSKIEKKNTSRPRLVCITQGTDPTIVVIDCKVSEYPVPKISGDKIVDSNGAGDAFVGGFMATLMKLGGKFDDKTIEACCKAGNYSAGVIIQVSGTVISGKPDATKF